MELCTDFNCKISASSTTAHCNANASSSLRRHDEAHCSDSCCSTDSSARWLPDTS